MPTNPTIFVSHSHLDTDWCRPFVAALQAGGLDVWYDEIGLQAGAAWVKVIQTEVQARDIFLLVLTPNAWASEWVQEEIQLALATHRRVMVVEHLPTQVNGFLLIRQWIRVVGLDAPAAAQRVAADLIAAEIASDRVIDSRDPPLPPPPNDRDEIGIPERLYRLGYRGWRMLRTGLSYIEPPTCQVKAGLFVMGSADSDAQALDNEKPQYHIPVGAFAIGKYPVTVEEYSYYLTANPGVTPPRAITFGNHRWVAPELRDKVLSWGIQQQRSDHPVVCVTWLNVCNYMEWLAQTTGQPWRMPTEAEWEKAARWDETRQHARLYPWGDTYDLRMCNATYENGDINIGKTTPVGAYPTGASPYGAQDMAGNVWEWCSVWNKAQYGYAPSQSEGNEREGIPVGVLRGGSWNYTLRYARTAYRYTRNPNNLINARGFRVCLRAVSS